MPVILIGQHCRLCRALIPNSIAGQPTNVVAAKLSGTALPTIASKSTFGSEENQYLCEKCLAQSFVDLNQLQGEIGEFWQKTNEVEIDMGIGVAPPCAKCRTEEGDERVLEMNYEGRAAMLCRPCGDAYLRANRSKISGTKLEYDLKLR